MDFAKKIANLHPHILGMREFATNEALCAALVPGARYYEIHTDFTQPAHVSGPYTVESVWGRARSIYYRVTVRNTHQEVSSHYVGDMQNTLAKAVFTDQEKAREYFRACRLAYDRSAEWRAHVKALRADHNSFVNAVVLELHEHH